MMVLPCQWPHEPPGSQNRPPSFCGPDGTASEPPFLNNSNTWRWPASMAQPRSPKSPAATDPFDEIDFGSSFDDYLDPGYKSPAAESVEKPSFETFLSAPMTLGDHLRSQLSVSLASEGVRDAAESIIGNLDEDGYLTASLEEIAAAGEHTAEQVEEALR